MKTRKINIIEIVLFLLFSSSYFFQKAGTMHHYSWVVLVLFFLLGILYFPLGFYTLKSPKFSTVYSILFGLLFSLALTGIFYSLTKAVLTPVVLLGSITIFFTVAIIQTISFYLFSKTEGQIVMYDYGMTIRYVILFGFLIYALVTYDFHSLFLNGSVTKRC